MTKEEFQAYEQKYYSKIEDIRASAHDVHQQVNQLYGENLPYGFHLDMVAYGVSKYGYLVCDKEDDVLSLFFAAFFHDSIEDARMSYNDVMHVARMKMKEEQALMATEIVYALTNDKGRTRAERAGENYYKGIRATPYAPFVKLCDRLANVTYSCTNRNNHMMRVYKGEMGHFLNAINPHSDDIRFQVPYEVIEAMAQMLIDEQDRDEEMRQWGESGIGL